MAMPLLPTFIFMLCLLSNDPGSHADSPARAGVASRDDHAVLPKAEVRLIAAKSALMQADYRADLRELSRIRESLADLETDPDWAYLAYYWRGYASWHIAMNGTNRGMPKDEVKAHVSEAITDFESSLRMHPEFADSAAAAASLHSWSGILGDPASEAAQKDRKRAAELLSISLNLDPDNPRVLWVEGGRFLFAPRAWGGDPIRAERIYQRITTTAPPLAPDSPFPDWGKAEAFMSLAFLRVNQDPPDVAQARTYAQAALQVRSDWSYVKDLLIPQIDAAAAKAKP